MQGKDGAGQPRAGNLQSAQRTPEKNGSKRMQEDVLNVIGRRPKSPETVVEPEAGAGERDVLLQDRGMNPQGEQPGSAFEIGLQSGRPGIVIPNELPAQAGKIGEECCRQQQQGKQKIPGPLLLRRRDLFGRWHGLH